MATHLPSLQQQLPCRPLHVETHTPSPQPKAVFMAAYVENCIYFYCLLIRSGCVRGVTLQLWSNDWL